MPVLYSAPRDVGVAAPTWKGVRFYTRCIRIREFGGFNNIRSPHDGGGRQCTSKGMKPDFEDNAVRWETSLVATKAQMMKNRGSCTPKYMSPGIGTRVHTTP
eukprot:m.154239 g.154239  ORF g.154239 m.154239 type:complete len:102 (+) comp23494_c0_seq2:1923-2228(+)